MAPKAAAEKSSSRAQAKGKGKGGENTQSSKLEYALPPAMVTCLQAITARSTQDLWSMPTSIPGDMSVEQQAQRRAAAMGKLSKRLSGDMRAKEELRLSLQQWALAVAVHLAGLVQRAKALGDKVDADLTEALREMRSALDQQPSSTTAEQVALATNEVGRPIWNVVQEQEIFRIAAGLRAFGTVDFPERGLDGVSEVSFGGGLGNGIPGIDQSGLAAGPAAGPVGHQHASPMPVRATSAWATEGGHPAIGLPASGSVAVDDARPTRWKRRQGTDTHRPSKSPRREEPPAAPWPATATGRTPEAVHRCPVTEIQEAPDGCGASSSPRPRLCGALCRPQARTLCLRLQEVLNQLRMCPSALSGVRQGVVLLAQATVGNLLDPYAYAPTTAQEWLYPAAIVEHGSLVKGHVPSEVSRCPEIQTLLAQRCPAFWEVSEDGIPELF